MTIYVNLITSLCYETYMKRIHTMATSILSSQEYVIPIEPPSLLGLTMHACFMLKTFQYAHLYHMLEYA